MTIGMRDALATDPADTDVAEVTAAVGRQIIADAAGQTVGYELLFRAVDGSGPGESDLSGPDMTAAVIYNSLSLGLTRLVAGKLLFVNADREVLLHPSELALSPENTVLEILETVVVDAEVLAGCTVLRQLGFELALDDFTWFDGAEEILDLVSYVKVDLLALPRAEVRELARRCARHSVCLIAEKIENLDQLPWLQDVGFQLFQGYAIERPALITGPMLSATSMGRLNLAMTLVGQDIDFAKLEEILRTEPGLTHQVLNMAAVGRLGSTRRRIGSIRQALVLLGPRRIQSWIALLLVHSAGPGTYDGLQTALTRARACEILAIASKQVPASTAFTAGMISAFDVLLGTSARELATNLPLSDELREAAFGCTSAASHIIQDSIDYQTGLANPRMLSNFSVPQLDAAFAQAFTWSLAHSAQAGGS